MINKRYIALAVTILIIAGISYYFHYYNGINDKEILDKKLSCENDDDCVAASCCHADSCVNKAYKPECSGIFCSQECKSGTLDCQQARCGCVKNKCNMVKK